MLRLAVRVCVCVCGGNGECCGIVLHEHWKECCGTPFSLFLIAVADRKWLRCKFYFMRKLNWTIHTKVRRELTERYEYVEPFYYSVHYDDGAWRSNAMPWILMRGQQMELKKEMQLHRSARGSHKLHNSQNAIESANEDSDFYDYHHLYSPVRRNASRKIEIHSAEKIICIFQFFTATAAIKCISNGSQGSSPTVAISRYIVNWFLFASSRVTLRFHAIYRFTRPERSPHSMAGDANNMSDDKIIIM